MGDSELGFCWLIVETMTLFRCLFLLYVLKLLLLSFKLSQSYCSLLQPTVTEDFSHLPPEQRRKRLQQKLDDICKELQKEVDQRCVFMHMFVCSAY